MVTDKEHLSVVDLGILHITDRVVLEGDLAIELFIHTLGAFGEKVFIIQLLKAEIRELRVGKRPVERLLLKGDPDQFGAGGKPEHLGAVMVVQRLLTIDLKVAVIRNKIMRFVAEIILAVLHQHQNIAQPPCQKYTLSRKLPELRHHMGEGVMTFGQLLIGNVRQSGDMRIELLRDLRGDKLREGVDDIQFFVQLDGAELNDLIKEFVPFL